MRVRNGHWIALSSLLVLTAAFLFHETRDTTFWFDEWRFVVDRRDNDLAAFLEPHNEHLSLVPVALYKLLFATAGLDDYAPYRVMVIAAHLACVVLVFALARRQVGNTLALAAAALLLCFGPGWQNILWPFQVGSLISIAAGLGALLTLDREDRAGDVAACALLASSLASSGLGVPIAAGLVVDVLLRRRLRSAWIVAAPLAVYAAWWLAYRPAGLIRHNVVLLPGFVADAAAGVVSALAGLADAPIGGEGGTLGWGRPLAVAFAALVIWRLTTMRNVPPRVWTLLTVLVSFWVLTGLRRAELIRPDETRYIYFGAVFLVLLGAELASGVAPPRRAGPIMAACAVVLAIVVANVGDLREGARFIRTQAAITRADLGALELARSRVAPDFVVQGLPGYPLVVVYAGSYFAQAREHGSPAATPEAIASAPEDARRVADGELTRAYAIELRPGRSGGPDGRPPEVDAASGGTVHDERGCVAFSSPASAPADAAHELQLTLPAAGLTLTTDGGPATVSVRRFADGFPEQPLARLAADATGTLRIPRDAGAATWHVRITPEARVTACSLQDVP